MKRAKQWAFDDDEKAEFLGVALQDKCTTSGHITDLEYEC